MKQDTSRLPLLAGLAQALKKLPESAKALVSMAAPVAPRSRLNRAQRRRMSHVMRKQMRAEYARAKAHAKHAPKA